MSLLLPKGGPVSPAPRTGRAPVWIWVGAVLLAGGAGGWALNQALSPGVPDEALASPLADSLTVGTDDGTASISLVSGAGAGIAPHRPSHTELAAIESAPPPNPFVPQGAASGAGLPVAATPSPGAPGAVAAVRVKGGASSRSATEAPAAAPAAAPIAAPSGPARPSPAPLQAPDGLVLTGIIQGEPALAVLRWNEQTMFLKIGDPIADTWRLDEIRERSVVLRLSGKAGSEQRVEIPLRGGNSQ